MKKNIGDILQSVYERADRVTIASAGERELAMTPEQLQKHIKKMHNEMVKAAGDLEFEKAAKIRDEIKRLEELDLALR